MPENFEKPAPNRDGARWKVDTKVQKFHGDVAEYEARFGRELGLAKFLEENAPYETLEGGGNLLTLVGADFLIDQMITGGTTGVFNSTNAHIGVGDSSTAAANSQTDLQASTNKFRKQVSGAPTHTDGTNTVSFTSAFGSSEANFAWQEWGLFNNSSGGVLFNRKVESWGSKASGSTWTFTVTLTLS
jgi:hypothetical protein